MSRSYRSEFRLAAERRRQIFEARVRARTQPFYERYRAQEKELLNLGAVTYLPVEMHRLSSDLNQISVLLQSNPEEAREISFSVGRYISSLHGMLRNAKREFAEQERQQQEAAMRAKVESANKIRQTYNEFLAQLAPAHAHFAKKELDRIHHTLESDHYESPDDLLDELRSIAANAEQKAFAWCQKQAKAQDKQVTTSRIDAVKAKIQQDQPVIKEKKQILIQELQDLQNLLDTGNNPSDILKKTEMIEKASDDLMVEEDVQKALVQDVCRVIYGMGFQVGQPVIDKGVVYISSSSPDGRKANFVVDTMGMGGFDFNGHRGMMCCKDIDKFKSKMKEIYLTDVVEKQLLWENPDKLEMNAEQMPTEEGRTSSWH